MTFKPDYRGIGELLKSPEMEAEMLRRAKKVLDVCVATAPVDLKSPHVGRYKASFHASSGRRTDRAYGMVTNAAPEAILVEYGSKNNPRHRTMGKALDAAKD